VSSQFKALKEVWYLVFFTNFCLCQYMNWLALAKMETATQDTRDIQHGKRYTAVGHRAGTETRGIQQGRGCIATQEDTGKREYKAEKAWKQQGTETPDTVASKVPNIEKRVS
jgi:hypothetical protein